VHFLCPISIWIIYQCALCTILYVKFLYICPPWTISLEKTPIYSCASYVLAMYMNQIWCLISTHYFHITTVNPKYVHTVHALHAGDLVVWIHPICFLDWCKSKMFTITDRKWVATKFVFVDIRWFFNTCTTLKTMAKKMHLFYKCDIYMLSLQYFHLKKFLTNFTFFLAWFSFM
jgi:hypothetical protein